MRLQEAHLTDSEGGDSNMIQQIHLAISHFISPSRSRPATPLFSLCLFFFFLFSLSLSLSPSLVPSLSLISAHLSLSISLSLYIYMYISLYVSIYSPPPSLSLSSPHVFFFSLSLSISRSLFLSLSSSPLSLFVSRSSSLVRQSLELLKGPVWWPWSALGPAEGGHDMQQGSVSSAPAHRSMSIWHDMLLWQP